MKIQLQKIVFVLGLSLLINNVNAQLIDSLKSKTKIAADKVSNVFKKANKKSELPATGTNPVSDQPTKSAPVVKSDNKQPAAPEEGYIDIPSPSKSFKSFRLPGYKNKVIMGPGVPYKKNTVYESNDNNILKSDNALHVYKKMLSMKVIDTLYNYLDTKKLTTTDDNKQTHGSPDLLSKRAQYHLSDMGATLCANETAGKYFCKGGACQQGQKPSPVGGWGGIGSNEFERQEAYLSFIKDNKHSELRNWWNKMERDIYYVVPEQLPAYNFEKQGFDLRLSASAFAGAQYYAANGTEIVYLNDIYANNGNNSVNNTQFNILLPMKPDEAKALKQRQDKNQVQAFYYVYHIVFYSGVRNSTRNSISNASNLYYYLKSNNVEIFEDAELKNKVGELTLPIKKAEVKEEKLEFVDIVSPSKNFSNLNLHAFRNKVRLGSQVRPTNESREAEESYMELLKTKIVDSVFNLLDTKKITKEGPRSEAQYKLRNLAFMLSNDAHKQKYFCPNGKCSDHRGPIAAWAGGVSSGQDVTEFDEQEAYQTFIKDNNFTALRNWWNKMDREAYYVSEVALGEYNFDKEGFDVSLSPGYYGHMSYVPRLENGKVPPDNRNKAFNTLIPLKPEAAKELRKRQKENRNNNVYIVYNIVFYDKYVGHGTHQLSFYLKTTKVEIFEDIALTKKIGEVSMQ